MKVDTLTTLSPQKKRELLSRLLREKSTGEITRPLPAIVSLPDDRYAPFPLTDVQQAYWIGRSGNLELGNVSCHIYFELDVEDFDLPRLNEAWQRLIERHDMLRAIVRADGQQQVLEHVGRYEIAVTDLLLAESAEVERHLAGVREELSHQVRAADQWPLFELRASVIEEWRVRLHLSFDLLIIDFWSFQILFKELLYLYRQPDAVLPELEITFRDYVLAEKQILATTAYKRAETYWLGRVPTLPPGPELPLARNPRSIIRPRFERRQSKLAPDLWRQLKTRAAEAGLTTSVVLLTAYAEVLTRWSKSGHFTLNLTMFNRYGMHRQVNELVGDFTSVNLLEVRHTEAESFMVRVRRLQEQLWNDMDHRQFSGIQVLRELMKRQGSASRMLMPVVFTSTLSLERRAQNASVPTLMMPGELAFGITQTPQVWLDHQVFEEEGALVYNWDGVEELFPAGMLDDMFSSYGGLLERLAREPESWQEQRRELLPEYQRRQRERSPEERGEVSSKLLQELFAERVEEESERVAVMSSERELSYGELQRRARQLAAELRGCGGGERNELVAVVMEKGWEQVVAVLGILEAGAAYLPLDAHLPKERLWQLLAQGEVKVAVTQQRLAERLAWPAGVARICVAEAAPEASETTEREAPAAVQGPDDLAYVIFTSGSTGQPKGVMISHRGAVNTIVDINERLGVGPGDRVLALSSLSFDLSVYDIFGSLAAGAAIVFPEPEAERDPRQWAATLRQGRVTIWNSVPALMNMLVEHLRGGGEKLAETLRVVMLSGDWIPVALPGEIKELSRAGMKVYSLGGATEASIWSIIYEIGEVGAQWKSIPYGHALSNQHWQVFNQTLEACPTWTTGELYIGGVGLAQGYWRDVEKSEQSFVRHPRTGERWYRTGDLGRYMGDGEIEFLGREDTQVKVQGYRIELAEVEAALEQHERVRESAVVAAGAAGERRRLVAYVVLVESESNGGGQALGRELREYLLTRLPEYMVPASYVKLAQLPLTGNGKVDRGRLPAATAVTEVAPGEYIAPRTELEQQMVNLWQEVLGVQLIGIHDNFFELGGDSLLAIRLTSRIREVFQTEIPLRVLFEAPTAASLTEATSRDRCEQISEGRFDEALPAIIPAPSERYAPFPLTEVQQAYLIGRGEFFELGNIAAHFYLELEASDLDLERFNEAWQRLIERHDMLRTIVRANGQQQVLEHVGRYEIAVTDLLLAESAEVERHLAGVREELSHQVRAADQWPLFELRASVIEERRVRLHLSFDLLIIDFWSFQILARELFTIYGDLEATLEPLEISFRDYVLAEKALRETEVYSRSNEYWKQRLPTLPPGPELPLACNPKSITRPRFERRQSELAPDLWRRLKTRAAEAGLTTSAVLLTAYAEVLTRWSKSGHFTLNLTMFNRYGMHRQVNELVGDFTSVNLLEVRHTEAESFMVRVRRLQEQLWNDMDHRYVHGVELMRELARLRGGIAHAVAPVVFTSTLSLASSLSDITSMNIFGKVVHSITQTPQVWLDHQVFEEEGALVYNWDGVEELFPAGMLDDMFSSYGGLLERLAGEPESWQEQRRELLPEYQRRQRESSPEERGEVSSKLLQELFAERVEEESERVAVISSERELSYGELQRRARQLAGELRGCGGGERNELVAVVMEKGWEQVVAVLGILEAGAAYLPLDAHLPKERLWQLLAQGEVKVAVTQQRLAERLAWPAGVARICVAEAAPEASETTEREAPAAVQGPDDLAYVIFTSGSTGQPKGVMISHRGAVNTIVDINERLGVGPGDRVLALSSLSFDLSVYDIFGSLAAGAAIVFPEPEAERDPRQWAATLRQGRVTIWNSVPALMNMLVEHLRGGGEKLAETLRVVMLSGDWIPVALPGEIKELSRAGMKVYSLGGATEASIWSIIYEIGEVGAQWKSIPYGHALSNQHWQVFNQTLEACPTWTTGELYIGGVGLAQGYWRDVEKSEQSFVRHPRTGERWYRTGDLGRYMGERGDRVSGARRHAGEGARLPHRVGGGGGGAGAARAGAGERGGSGRGSRGAAAAGGLRSAGGEREQWRRPGAGPRVARVFTDQAAGVYGAGQLCEAGATAADRKRQSRSRPPAGGHCRDRGCAGRIYRPAH